MAEKALRIALVGAGDLGGKCLDALADVPSLQLVGVADRSPAGKQAAASAGVEFFSDHRQLLGQLRPDVLLVATPPGATVDLVRLAAQQNVHVVKGAPLARTLDEAAEMVGAMAGTGRGFAVLTPRRFNASYRALIGRRQRMGRLFLGRAHHVLNWGLEFGWRSDKASAGGGVLLEAGYQMIDLLVWAMGLPEEVYAVTGRHGRPHMVEAGGEVESLGIYDTDDSAVVVLRHADAAGTVTASWVTSPPGEELLLHGQQGSGQASATRCVFRDDGGTVLEAIDSDDRPASALAEQLRGLAEAFLKADAASDSEQLNRCPCESSAREHLLTMAVVEAAYLSDRTGQPEDPRHLLEARGYPPATCLADRPADPDDADSPGPQPPR